MKPICVAIFGMLISYSSVRSTSAESTLTLAEAQRLIIETGMIDGNVTLGLHANLVDEKGKAVVHRLSYEKRIEIARNQLHLRAMTWTVSSSLSGLARRVASLDKRTDVLVVRNSADLDRTRKKNQLAVIFYSQRHYPLKGDVRRLEKFFDEGLRVFQIAYGGSDGANLAHDERLGAGGFDANRKYRSKHGITYTEFGLTNLGKRAVRKLNELHLLIDVSHCHENTIADVVAISRDPVIANHANAYARTRSERNLSNMALRQIARSGGVIGVMPIGAYVDTNRDGATVQDFIQ